MCVIMGRIEEQRDGWLEVYRTSNEGTFHRVEGDRMYEVLCRQVQIHKGICDKCKEAQCQRPAK